MTHEKFAKTLKHWRDRKGFTQQDAAKSLGISVRTLQNWEIARYMPRGFGLNALILLIGEKPKRR
jgi:DNA-binding transcriptional regulator YiaG